MTTTAPLKTIATPNSPYLTPPTAPPTAPAAPVTPAKRIDSLYAEIEDLKRQQSAEEAEAARPRIEFDTAHDRYLNLLAKIRNNRVRLNTHLEATKDAEQAVQRSLDDASSRVPLGEIFRADTNSDLVRNRKVTDLFEAWFQIAEPRLADYEKKLLEKALAGGFQAELPAELLLKIK